jgi:hypothetical protein
VIVHTGLVVATPPQTSNRVLPLTRTRRRKSVLQPAEALLATEGGRGSKCLSGDALFLGATGAMLLPIGLIRPIGRIRIAPTHRPRLGAAAGRESCVRGARLLGRSRALDGGSADRGDSSSGESSR